MIIFSLRILAIVAAYFSAGECLSLTSTAFKERMTDCTNVKRRTKVDNSSNPVTFR